MRETEQNMRPLGDELAAAAAPARMGGPGAVQPGRLPAQPGSDDVGIGDLLFGREDTEGGNVVGILPSVRETLLGTAGLGDIAARVLPNTADTIGSMTTGAIAGGQSASLDVEAEGIREQMARLRRGGDLFGIQNRPEIFRRYQARLDEIELERAQAQRLGQEARLGGAEAIPEDAGILESAVQHGLATSAVVVPAAIATGGPGAAAIMGVGTGLERYGELTGEGVDTDSAARSSILLGALEGLTEYLPAEALLKKSPGFEGFKAKLAEFFLSELPGENVNTIAQLVDDYGQGIRDDLTVADFRDAIAETTLQAAVGGGIQVGGVQVIQALSDRLMGGPGAQAAPDAPGATPAPPALPPAEGGPVQPPGADVGGFGGAQRAVELPFQIEPEYTPAEFEAETQRQPRNAERDSLLEYLSKSRDGRALTGGISTEEAIAQGLDPSVLRSTLGAGILRPFTKGGMSFDAAAELLSEAGYPVTNEDGNYDPNVLLDAIDRELRGEKVYSTRNQQALEDLFEDEARAYYGDSAGEVEASRSPAPPPGFVREQPRTQTLPDRMQALAAELEQQEQLVDAAYAAGDPRAEDLDARLAEIRDELEGMTAANLESGEYDEGDQGDVEPDLVRSYARFAAGEQTREDLIAQGRDILVTAGAERDRMTDDAVFAAAEDAHAAALERRARRQAAPIGDDVAAAVRPRQPKSLRDLELALEDPDVRVWLPDAMESGYTEVTKPDQIIGGVSDYEIWSADVDPNAIDTRGPEVREGPPQIPAADATVETRGPDVEDVTLTNEGFLSSTRRSRAITLEGVPDTGRFDDTIDADVNEALERYLAEKTGGGQSGAGPAKAESAAAVRDLAGSGTVFGRRYARELATKERASLVGQRIESPEDLAFAAQVYRDPRFETLRVFFTNAEGTVVSQLGMTQRLVDGAVAVIGENGPYFRKLFLAAKNAGATRFWMQHNHPSGDSSPSSADMRITQLYANQLQAGLEFGGHVVINHNEYSAISGDGVIMQDAAGKLIERREVDFGHGEKPFAPQIGAPESLAVLAGRMVDPDHVTLVMTTTRHTLHRITYIPFDALKPALPGSKNREKNDRANKRLIRRLLLETPGTGQLFAVTTNPAAVEFIAPYALDTILVDADGRLIRSNATAGKFGKAPFVYPRQTRVTPDSSPEFDYLKKVLEEERKLEEARKRALPPAAGVQEDVGEDRRSQPRGRDRRADQGERKRVDDMTADELKRELLTHEVTGIPNRRAYEEADKLPIQAAIDVDSLKWVNDNMGHESGDQLLRAVADALADETDQAFHISGDEFVLQAGDRGQARALLALVEARLANARIEVELADGSTVQLKGIGISYGLGEDLNAADTQLAKAKETREARGERAARGEAPRGAERRARGRQNQERDAASEAQVEEPRSPYVATPAFQRWFGQSVVTVDGKPGSEALVVYRGEHGETDAELHTRSPMLTFSESPAPASTYATAPNRRADVVAKPRVTPAFLRIERPFINTPGDPFVDMSRLIETLGREKAETIARDLEEQITSTGQWDEDYRADFTGVADLLERAPERLGELYMLAYPVLDNATYAGWIKAAGFDGAIHAGSGVTMLEPEYKVFDAKQVKSAIGNRGTFDPDAESIVREEAGTYEDPALNKIRTEVDELEQRLGAPQKGGMFGGGPGKAYVPGYSWGMPMPLKGEPQDLRTGTVDPPKAGEQPIRREHVMELFQRLFDLKIYEGKPFKVRQALGFFRPRNYEIRIKKKSDLEVAAHEVFHWLDRTYPTLRKLYHQRKFRDELLGVSYDDTLIFEGFAEFGRLYMTQEIEAIGRTPKFYDAFTAEADKLGILEKLDRVQRLMHAWYAQGVDNRAQSKIGNLPAPVPQRLGAALDMWESKAIARSVDWLHVVKTIEAKTRGGIHDDAAWSPYKSMRLLAGIKSQINAWLNYGTQTWTKEGDLEFNGPSLKTIFEPIGDVFDDAMAYFVGRRARELRAYGKENLFTDDEIKALLDRGRKSKKSEAIEQAFRDYQEYTKRLLDFAQQSGILNGATRAMWEKLYQNYVPFYRVADRMGSTMDQMPTGHGQVFKRLFGGTANLRDTFDNITQNTAAVVTAAMRNIAKRQLFAMIDSSPLGQRYAVRIPTDSEVVNVTAEQLESVIRSLAKAADEAAANAKGDGLDAAAAEAAQIAMLARALANRDEDLGQMPIKDVKAQFQFFFAGRPPNIPDKDWILIDGKPVYFQIGDPMLWDMLTNLNYARPLGLAERALGMFSRLLRRGVTLDPTFQVRNLTRDVMNAFTMSRGGQIPFVDAIKALRDIWTESDHFRDFMGNGGGYGLMVGEEARRVRSRLRRYRFGFVPVMNAQDLFDTWDKWGWSFELATRLAEYKRIREQGRSRREATYQGREISTDFAMHGNASLVQLIKGGTTFWNARLQGLYRLERELFERKGRQSLMGDRMFHYAVRGLVALTFPSLIAYWMFKDDDEYKDLPEDVKSLYTYVRGPDGVPILIPRPFETGALFQEIPIRILEAIREENGDKLTDAMMFMLMETFALDPTFQAVQPVRDVFWRNSTWNGFPVVPRSLEDVTPAEQYQPWTSETFKRVGELFGVSPIKLEQLYRGYTAQMGMYALAATDALITLDEEAEDPKTSLSTWPVLRGFTRDTPYRNTAQEQAYYELLDEITEVVATARKMRREGRGDDLEMWLTEPERELLAGLEPAANAVDEALSNIRAQRQEIYNDTEMSAEEKADELDILQAEENQLFKDVVAGMDEARLEELRRALGGLP